MGRGLFKSCMGMGVTHRLREDQDSKFQLQIGGLQIESEDCKLTDLESHAGSHVEGHRWDRNPSF